MPLGLSLRMPYLAVMRAPAGGYDPLVAFAGDLAGWYDALEAGTLFSDAGVTPAGLTDPVQQWNDQSGNANHLAQGTLASRPTRAATGLTFDGADSIIRTASLTGLPGAQPYTVICVASLTTNSSDLWGTSASGLFGRTGAATGCRLSFGAGPISSAGVPALDTARDILCEASGASCKVDIGGSNFITGNAGTQLPSQIRVGCNAAGAGNIVGAIMLFGIVRRLLTAPEKAAFHAYCVTRFGVP